MKLFSNKWAYSLSLLAATGLALAITIYPAGMVHDGAPIDHGLLSLLMLGMSAGFVHGFGFIPDNRWMRLLLGPYVAWPILLLGWVLFIRNYLA
jgi:predicted membrane protein